MKSTDIGRVHYLHVRLVARVRDDGVVVREQRPVDLQSVLDLLVVLEVREVVVEDGAVPE